MKPLDSRRPGYALIEILVVVTLLGLMLGLAAGMIHMLLKLDRGGRSSAEQAVDLARLARDFRRDAHAADPSKPVVSTPATLTLTIEGGRTIEYLARTSDIVRTLREGDKVRHYDLYRRPARSTIAFEVTREGPGSFATLIVDRLPDGRDDSLYRDYRIEAELGRPGRKDGGTP